MFHIYHDVGEIIHESIIAAMEGAPELVEILPWINKLPNKLPNKLFNSAWNLNQTVAEAAVQLTDSYEPGQGQYKCGAIKVLKFKWKSNPIPQPSAIPELQDTTYPYKHSVWTALKKDLARLPDKDVQVLLHNLQDAIKLWGDVFTSTEDHNEMLLSATRYYGGPDDVIPYKTIVTLNKGLKHICKLLERILAEERCIGNTK